MKVSLLWEVDGYQRASTNSFAEVSILWSSFNDESWKIEKGCFPNIDIEELYYYNEIGSENPESDIFKFLIRIIL